MIGANDQAKIRSGLNFSNKEKILILLCLSYNQTRFWKIPLPLLSFPTEHETFTNYFTPEHGGQIVPDVDGTLLAELTHA